MNDCWIFKQLHRPKHIITWFNLDVSLTAFKINTKLSYMSSRSSGCLKNILQPTNGQYENQSDFYFCLLGNIKCGLSRLLRMVVSGKWWEKTLKLDFKLIDSAVFSHKIATNINKLWDEYIQNINEWWQKRYRFSRISEHQPKCYQRVENYCQETKGETNQTHTRIPSGPGEVLTGWHFQL